METFYLVDFENVHNEGIENVDKLSKADHVHIFSTENALKNGYSIFKGDRYERTYCPCTKAIIGYASGIISGISFRNIWKAI